MRGVLSTGVSRTVHCIHNIHLVPGTSTKASKYHRCGIIHGRSRRVLVDNKTTVPKCRGIVMVSFCQIVAVTVVI